MRFRLGCSAFDTTDFGIFFHAWTSETLTPQVVAPGSARRLERTNSGLQTAVLPLRHPCPCLVIFCTCPKKHERALPKQMQPLSMVETGGSLSQVPGKQNGSPLSSAGGLLPTLGVDRVSSGLATNGGSYTIQLDGPATVKLLRGEAVSAIASSPRTVQGELVESRDTSILPNRSTELPFMFAAMSKPVDSSAGASPSATLTRTDTRSA